MSQALRKAQAARVNIAWVISIILSLLAMRLIPDWETIPFLVIWVTLTAAYGFRLWKPARHGAGDREGQLLRQPKSGVFESRQSGGMLAVG